jgi:diadenosine tetraphosphate (Ap4A) HIT family hydrolase
LYEGGSVGRVLGFRLVGVEGCLACDLAEGRIDLPGGRIFETDLWIVEHCVGPLGIGTLVVKPKRHVVHLWELRDDESDALGPLLVRVAAAVEGLTQPEQIYVALWSHSGGVPGHIHFVIQPVTSTLMEEYGQLHGPSLQLAMFERNEVLDRAQVESFADAARSALAN